MTDAPKLTRKELVQYSNPNTTFYGPAIRDLAAYALTLLDELEIERAKNAVRGGEWCAENRAAGRDRCGACAWCCSFEKDRAEKAEQELAALREVVKVADELVNISDNFLRDEDDEELFRSFLSAYQQARAKVTLP